ncbi:MAG: 3-oxoacyl-ACP synthase III [Victivallales bacterium]|nr:3-oxoacyl-ACP synthase III [Victivallales bacterium]
MRLGHVNLLAFAQVTAPITMTSADLEERLRPFYERLHLPEGRLEMMTGIRERRFWTPGTLPSEVAAEAGRLALQKARLEAAALDAVVFCGVSHDFAEPATSTAVVNRLGLHDDILNFDLSNACLGMASGIQMLAALLERGEIRCALAVTGENGGPLVENTIRHLLEDASVTRQSLKREFANLTIGSAACAVLLARDDFDCPVKGHHLKVVVNASSCGQQALCQGMVADGAMTENSHPTMQTDSHELMVQGIQVACRMWERLKAEAGWSDGQLPDLICGHQVSRIHRDQLFAKLGLPVSLDYPVFERFGNCGSASLPLAVTLAEETGALRDGMRLAMLGIGSGINAAGLAVDW